MLGSDAAKAGAPEALVLGFDEMTERVLDREIWERPALSKRDRSLLTLAAILTANPHEQLASHIAGALDNGLTMEELGEAMLHLAFYASWPASIAASRTLFDVARERTRCPCCD